jgi:hypothetical protein
VKQLVRNSSSESSIAATIFDLAHRDIIHIQETQEKKWYGRNKDVVLTKIRDNERYDFERMLTQELTSPEGTRLFSKRGKLTGLSQKFEKEVAAEAVRQGFFAEEPSRSTRALWIPGLIMAVVGVLVGIALTALFFSWAEFILRLRVLLILGIAAVVTLERMVKYTERAPASPLNGKPSADI